MKYIKYVVLVFSLVILPLYLIFQHAQLPFDAPMKLGGNWVSAKKLNMGYETYMQYCMQCHGVNGDGKGPASLGAYPPPRNFVEGTFKFAQVEAGELPRDEDLAHTIRYGLNGTPMLPWDISDKRLSAVIQYIKTFSEVWKDDDAAAGEPLAQSSDPFRQGKEAEAIALGEKVYHGVGKCFTCHPGYLTKDEIDTVSKEMTGDGYTDFRDDLHLSVPSASDYNAQFVPPDYTKRFIKSGYRVEDIYKVLNGGVNGTAMAAWKGLLSPSDNEEESERNQWALSYYIRSLQLLKFDWEARKKFMAELHTKKQK